MKAPKNCRIFAIFAMSILIFGCSQQRQNGGNEQIASVANSELIEQKASDYEDASSDAGMSQPSYRRQFAIIVGVDAYDPLASDLDPLQFAVNDASAIRDVLQREFGYNSERIRYLTNKNATLRSLKETLENWVSQQSLSSQDALLFFFAGHGLIDRRTRTGYVALFDSQRDSMDSTCLSVAEIRERLNAVPCRHKLIILDSCYSGTLLSSFRNDRVGAPPTSRSSASTKELRTGLRGEGDETRFDPLMDCYREPCFVGLTAGRVMPVADGLGASRHSIFTAALLQEFAERSDSTRPDQAFTFRQLASRVEARVRDLPGSQQLPDSGSLGPGRGDFVFKPSHRRPTPNQKARRLETAKTLHRAHELLVTDPRKAKSLLDSEATCPADMRGWAWRCLHALANPPHFRTCQTPCSPAWSLSYLENTGQVVVTGARQRGLALFSIDGLAESEVPKLNPAIHEIGYDNSSGYRSVACSAGGAYLAAGERNGNLRLWQMPNSLEIAKATCGKEISRLAFSPTEPLLAAGTSSGELYLYELPDLIEVEHSRDHTGVIHGIGFDAHGEVLTASWDGTARATSVKSPFEGKLFWRSSDMLHRVVTDTTNDRVLLTGESETVLLTATQRQPLWRMSKGAGAAALDSRGTWLATTVWGKENVVQVRDARDGEPVAAWEHAAPVTDMAITPDTGTLVATTLSGDVSVLNLRSLATVQGRVAQAFPASIRSLAFSPIADEIFVAIDRQLLYRVSLKSSKVLASAATPANVSTLSCSRDGTEIIAGTVDGYVLKYAAETLACRASSPTPLSTVLALAALFNDEVLVIGELGAVVLSDAGKVRRTLRHPTEASIVAATVSSEALSWGVIADDQSVHIYRDSLSQPFFTQRFSDSQVLSMAFSSQANLCATYTSDGSLRVWGTEGSAAEPRWIQSLPSQVRIQFVDGGNALAVVSAQLHLTLFDAHTGVEDLRFARCLNQHATCVSCSPNGETLAVGEAGGMLRLFSARKTDN